MIRFLTGMFALLVFAAMSHAALVGRVESIGFGSDMRADMWVPIKVSIQSDASEPFTGQLLVVQRDLNGDEVVYTRQAVTINSGRQEFWTYFKPTPINGLSEYPGTASELQKQLKVFLADKNDRKLIQFVIGANAPNILDGKEGVQSGKTILLVGSRGSAFITQLSDRSSNTTGLLESIRPIVTDVRSLPDNALGYQMVDSIVWLDADPTQLDGPQYKALTQWINGGGKLVVIQPTQWQLTRDKFGELLPVQIDGVRDVNSTEPLSRLAAVRPDTRRTVNGLVVPPLWPSTQLPQHIVHAKPIPSAWVEEWIDFSDTDRAPYIARRMIGLGSVTWVAQDLSDPSLPHQAFGWIYVWQRILGLKQADTAFPYGASKAPPETGAYGAVDVGKPMIEGMNLESRTTALVSVAFIFFIGYWAIAGPLSYVVLASKKKTQRSWMVFGAIALAATVLTLFLTRLLLRGSPEIRHVSVVRTIAGADVPARVMGRFGLYIPRDIRPQIGFATRSRDGITAITPFSMPPKYAPSNVIDRDSSYVIPLGQEDAADEVTIGVPIRSTLKKLQFDWTGPITNTITGKGQLDPDGTVTIRGDLVNNTPDDLFDVFIVFRNPSENFRLKEPWTDYVIYVPAWKKGAHLDLTNQFNAKDNDGKPRILVTLANTQEFNEGGKGFYSNHTVRGSLSTFAYFFYNGGYRFSSLAADAPDKSSGYMKSFFMLSLFDHLPIIDNSRSNTDRNELLRRGTRTWDVSHALECGRLIVLARSENSAIPAPLQVDGYAPEGKGTTYYQAILPLDYSLIEADQQKQREAKRAATQPSTTRPGTTQPTTKPKP